MASAYCQKYVCLESLGAAPRFQQQRLRFSQICFPLHVLLTNHLSLFLSHIYVFRVSTCFVCPPPPRSVTSGPASATPAGRKRPMRRRKSAIDLARSGWYDKIVMAIVRPPRCKYTQEDLGPMLMPLNRYLSLSVSVTGVLHACLSC